MSKDAPGITQKCLTCDTGEKSNHLARQKDFTIRWKDGPGNTNK